MKNFECYFWPNKQNKLHVSDVLKIEDAYKKNLSIFNVYQNIQKCTFLVNHFAIFGMKNIQDSCIVMHANLTEDVKRISYLKNGHYTTDSLITFLNDKLVFFNFKIMHSINEYESDISIEPIQSMKKAKSLRLELPINLAFLLGFCNYSDIVEMGNKSIWNLEFPKNQIRYFRANLTKHLTNISLHCNFLKNRSLTFVDSISLKEIDIVTALTSQVILTGLTSEKKEVSANGKWLLSEIF